MPDLSEESLWHWGCLTSSLRDTGEPARRRVEAVFGFGLNAPNSSPLLKFLLPSQLLKVKQGYSPSVVYFFAFSLVLLPQSPSGGSSLSMCVRSGSLGCRVFALSAPCQRKGISWAGPGLAGNCSQVYQTRMLPPDMQKWEGSAGTGKTIASRKWTWGDNFCTQLLKRILAKQSSLYQ